MSDRKYFVLFSLLLLSLIVYPQSNIDVLHYKFEIELSDRSDTIFGKTFVRFVFTEPADKFWLNLVSPDEKGKGMVVFEVQENNENDAFEQDKDTLFVRLKKIADKGETRTFEISYKGIPADGLIIAKNKYGDRTFFADNWPNRAHNWIPCKDEPDDKASFEFTVRAPSEYQVVSNGKLEEENSLPGGKKQTHWVEDVSLSTKVMVIGVAKFAVEQFADSPPGIPVSAWTYPQDSITGFRNYSVAPGIVKFYSDYIGPYPYNKLANVQSKTIFGGMENASCIFYYEESAEENRSMEDLLAHEIAHQWFGDMASEKSFAHLWLSEGFATYMTDIYLEKKYGTDSMNSRLIQERRTAVNFAKRSNRPVVDSVSALMNLLNANSYQKGAWVLHMLRRQMGDAVFQKFIRAYYDRYKGGNATTNDLEQVADEISHKDWKQFFQQWLYTPGVPQLNIQWSYDENNKTVSIRVDQIQKQGPFRFPLEIKLGDAKTETLNITRPGETFSFSVNSAINKIDVDPDVSLLSENRIEKLIP